jgi:hypothetical protein
MDALELQDKATATDYTVVAALQDTTRTRTCGDTLLQVCHFPVQWQLKLLFLIKLWALELLEDSTED